MGAGILAIALYFASPAPLSLQKIMQNMSENELAVLIERLKLLEYEIRKSITVREDQEDNVDPDQQDEARQCGLTVSEESSKGELLNAVQTAVRTAEARVLNQRKT